MCLFDSVCVCACVRVLTCVCLLRGCVFVRCAAFDVCVRAGVYMRMFVCAHIYIYMYIYTEMPCGTCKALQPTATHLSTLQHTTPHRNAFATTLKIGAAQHAQSNYSTLQQIPTLCNNTSTTTHWGCTARAKSLQRFATNGNTVQQRCIKTAMTQRQTLHQHCNNSQVLRGTRKVTATHCNRCQHCATTLQQHCNNTAITHRCCAARAKSLQHTAPDVNTVQQHCNNTASTLQ